MSALVALVATASSGCSSAPSADQTSPRTLVAWFRATQIATALDGMPELIGSWNGWQRPGLTAWQTRHDADGGEWLRLALPLDPGVYQYAIVADGTLVTDYQNPRTTYVADPLDPQSGAPYAVEVSEIEIADDSLPTLVVDRVTPTVDSISLEAHFVRGAAALDQVVAQLSNGAESLGALSVVRNGNRFTVNARGLQPGKYHLRLSATDQLGHSAAADASAFVEAETGRTLGDGLLYQIVIDRFRGDGALGPPSTPGERAGGTLDGVRAMIESGYFDQLGVTHLWLSPVYRNPTGEFVGSDGHLYRAYHGYWPEDPRGVDPLLAKNGDGEAALDQVIASAHGRGLRVLLDAVPNHVFQNHPYYASHASDWFNLPACICGAADCDWGSHIETCWFANYLPDLNWRDPEVMTQGVSDLAWWSSRFDLDGFRIDAVPMVPRAATRRIVHTVRNMTTRNGMDSFLLGENYTGAGDEGRSELTAYLGLTFDGLDSEFDFPLMWAMRDVIAHGNGGMDALEDEFTASERAFAGSGATMTHMLDNHDTTRFLSEIAGDADGDPWAAPPVQPTDLTVYQRQLLATAFMMTLPGMPVIYYGDELGLAGATDPDSRRVLPDLTQLSTSQSWLFERISKLGRARKCLPALRGQRTVLFVDADHEVLRYDAHGAETVVLSLSRGSENTSSLVSDLPEGNYVDLFSSHTLGSPIALDALSVGLYLPAESRCRE